MIPDFAWKIQRKKTKTHPNTKFLPIFNGGNINKIFECLDSCEQLAQKYGGARVSKHNTNKQIEKILNLSF